MGDGGTTDEALEVRGRENLFNGGGAVGRLYGGAHLVAVAKGDVDSVVLHRMIVKRAVVVAALQGYEYVS